MVFNNCPSLNAVSLIQCDMGCTLIVVVVNPSKVFLEFCVCMLSQNKEVKSSNTAAAAEQQETNGFARSVKTAECDSATVPTNYPTQRRLCFRPSALHDRRNTNRTKDFSKDYVVVTLMLKPVLSSSYQFFFFFVSCNV